MRDLAWSCFSPSIVQIEAVAGSATHVSACTPQLTPERIQWLEQLDHNPTALLQHLSVRPTHRLGVYFEQLWHFFLHQDRNIELIAHNLPIHDGGRTLGEFDCIYYCMERSCHVHLELAVKYFLGVPRGGDTTTQANAHEWLGPDQRDRLETKLDQLLQRQIMLGDKPAAKGKLQELDIGEMKREIALKGYLFQPRTDSPPPPPGYNSACTMGHWLPFAELGSHCAALGAIAFAILPKMQWLSSVRRDTRDGQLTQQELLAKVPLQWNDDDYPLLIAALDDTGAELSRFFVTPGSWPEINKR